ncbi:hypothetical protein [Dokdonella sp.]|uniref:hypothetical protein n=1 Tax=Dokdonella sp. TaxID=2291710 RepID=UPI0025BE8C63|nr:hypothetical protein [Dokdonella sp.]MBX3690237.1 hypothetical protein [Dokdonella sp.]
MQVPIARESERGSQAKARVWRRRASQLPLRRRDCVIAKPATSTKRNPQTHPMQLRHHWAAHGLRPEIGDKWQSTTPLRTPQKPKSRAAIV